MSESGPHTAHDQVSRQAPGPRAGRTLLTALDAGRIWLLTLLLVLAGASGARAEIQGFGTQTRGGDCDACVVYRVTTLDDNGNDNDPIAGSLREALSGSRRYVVFDVFGEITLAAPVYVRGSEITIDGFTAPSPDTGPSPGITLLHYGLIIHGTHGAHDVVVRGLRIRDLRLLNGIPMDGIQIARNASNVVVSHVSVWAGPEQTSGDGLIDITDGARDVTVAWSILAGSGKAMLVKYDASRVSLHHNIWVGGRNRNPQVSMNDLGTHAPQLGLTVDMWNNLVYDWKGGAGTAIHHGAWANVVNNFYSSPNDVLSDQEQALIVCRDGACFNTDNSSDARAFTQGNVSGDSLSIEINAVGTESSAFLVDYDYDPPVIPDACTAAKRVLDVLNGAGVRPLDATDRAFLDPITLPICRRTTTTLTATDSPTTLGQPITFTATVQARPPAVGAPDGSVTFFKGAVAMDTAPLVGGVSTLITTDLPQGTTTVKAVYSGEADFDGSQDSLKHKVVGAATTTELAALRDSPRLGAPVTLTAIVRALPPPSTATPEGSVRFFNGTRLLGTKPLAGGVATLVTFTLPAGLQTMKAQFMGNSGFAGSSSTALSLQIDGGTVTTLTRTPSSADTGELVTFTAKVTSMTDGSALDGTVTFLDGTAVLDSVTLAKGTAVLTRSNLPVGKHEVKASYSGSASFEPSVSSILSTNVVKGRTKTRLTSTSLTLPQGQPVTFTVEVTPVAPAAGTPGGSLRFKDGATTLATVNLSGGVAHFSTTKLGLGSHSISVAYDGSTQFKTSLSNKITVKVTAP